MKLHRIETGKVRIKSNQISRPGGLGPQMLQVLFGKDWSEWLPIYAWAIEHKEGVIVVDTGETHKTGIPGYLPRWHPYYSLAVQFDVKPKDEIECMLAVQMIAVHLNSMKMAYYASVKKQDIIASNSSVNNMTKLMRTFVMQLEALQKYKGKCNQTIQVQHVQINDGGQAVVGNIQRGE